jgi:hypothetical protein
MITIEVSASDGVGSNSWASASRLFAWRANSSSVALKTCASGRPSPNSTLPSPSTSGSAPFACSSGLVP